MQGEGYADVAIGTSNAPCVEIGIQNRINL